MPKAGYTQKTNSLWKQAQRNASSIARSDVNVIALGLGFGVDLKA